jgi:hypothetical protein
MRDQVSATTECLLVAEYVDDAGEPTGSEFGIAEVVPTRAIASYIDEGSMGGGIREYTILLKDDRIVSVRGEGLRFFAPSVPGGTGAYGIIVHAGGDEVLIALFTAPEVVGIFSGEIRLDRKSA